MSETPETAKETALALNSMGLWVTKVRPPDMTTGPDGKRSIGKVPIGKGWGLERASAFDLRESFDRRPRLSVGVVLGPGRGPGGSWLVDFEVDGPRGEDSLSKLFGDDSPSTLSWRSRRGRHSLWTVDGERLLLALRLAGGSEKSGSPGVYHLESLPDLEIRVGGFKTDGMVKQLQSVVPPSLNEDCSTRRDWLAFQAPADLPERVYQALESLAPAPPAEPPAVRPGSPTIAPGTADAIRDSAYARAALQRECDAVASAAEGSRNERLNKASFALGQLVGAGDLGRADVERALLDSALRSGLGVDEARVTIESGTTSGMASPRPVTRRAKGGSARKEKGGDGGKPAKPPTHAEILLDLASAAELFHDPDENPFARFPVGDHFENHPVRGGRFRGWLLREFFNREGRPPGNQTLQEVVDLLAARALFDGPTTAVFLRVGEHGGEIYIDLCDDRWRAVAVGAAGYRIVDDPPVRFVRHKKMLPLPDPVGGGDAVALLRPFLNLASADDLLLLIAWLVACFRPELHGPIPAIVLAGEQGSAKTSFLRVLRKIVDPHGSRPKPSPKEPRDAMVDARVNRTLQYDNLSRIPEWLSDLLCCIITGASTVSRELYTNGDGFYVDAQRIVTLAAITKVVVRPDLADRSIDLLLDPIGDATRIDDRVFWERFEAARPAIFGALLDLLVKALEALPGVTGSTSRMSDFHRLSEAVGRALGRPPGELSKIYRANRRGATEAVLADDVFAQSLLDLVDRGPWLGASQELLAALAANVGDAAAHAPGWPLTPRGVTAALDRLAPALRAEGVLIERPKRGVKRLIRIWREAPTSTPTPAATPTSTSTHGNGRGPRPMTGTGVPKAVF